MLPAIIIHLVYLAIALLLFRLGRRRWQVLPARRRRLVVSGWAALLFAPGIFWSFPFAVPSFALLALVVQLLASIDNGGLFLLPQLAFTFVPILVVWVTIFAVAEAWTALRASRPPAAE